MYSKKNNDKFEIFEELGHEADLEKTEVGENFTTSKDKILQQLEPPTDGTSSRKG